jgi:Tol biopolymer transport system component
MGEVYRARDSQLGRDVAIKVLANLSLDPGRLHRFEQEARAAAALNHPNILTVHQVGSHEGAPYLVSELLEGETLREQLRRGRLPIPKAIEYAVQIARGLAAAHEKGIIHRDLKPENLFITRDGRVKILDFGLAKLTQTGQTAESNAGTLTAGTEPGVVLGTVGYMSPEQVRGLGSDHHADIFAFGAVLYELLAGTRAFQKPTSAETMTAILNDDPPSISQLTPNVPPAVQRVLHRCLEKEPERRFQSASDLAFALEALSDSGVSAMGADAAPQKSRAMLGWIAAIGVAVIAVLLVTWWRSPAVAPQVESVVQLTHDGEPKPAPASMASDGSRVYFEERREGILTLAEVSVAGGETLPITTGLVNPQVLDISPDLSALLITNGMFEDSVVASLPLPAGQPRKLVKAGSAAYFPDGQHIVYCDGAAMFTAQRDGSNARKLAELPCFSSSPSISPDGSRIRLIVPNDFLGNSTSLWEVRSDGTQSHPVLPHWRQPPLELGGKWTPDGRFFVFERLEAGRADLWALPEKHGFFSRSPAEPVRLTNGPLSYQAALPSRDGTKIFVIGYQNHGELIRYDSVSRKFLPTLGGISATDVMYSADGQWVVYLSYPDHTLWRSRADGSERMQLTYPPMLVRYPHISLDGTKVTFEAWLPEKGNGAYIEDMLGGEVKYVADGIGPSWSPDGKSLVLTLRIPGEKLGEFRGEQLAIVDVASGKILTIPGSESKSTGPYWPLPGMIVAAGEHSTLYSYNPTTQAWSLLVDGPVDNWIPSPDSKYIYFTKETAENPAAMRVRLADGKIEPIVSLKNVRRVADPTVLGESSIGVAPDGSLLLTRDLSSQEVYALSVKWP